MHIFGTERHYLTVTSCQKIASSNTNINGVYKYMSSYFIRGSLFQTHIFY